MDRMPEWFADRFAFFVNEAQWTTLDIAAEHFWKEVLAHERFPTKQSPSLTGFTGWAEYCPKGCSAMTRKHFSPEPDGTGGLWACPHCKTQYTRADGDFVETEA